MNGERLTEKVTLKKDILAEGLEIEYADTVLFADSATSHAIYISKEAYLEMQKLFPV